MLFFLNFLRYNGNEKEDFIPMNRLIERFMTYVKVDTQSDHNSNTFPSTEKQKDLSKLLVKELKAMGLDAFMDAWGRDPSGFEGAYVCKRRDTSRDANGDAFGLDGHGGLRSRTGSLGQTSDVHLH